MVHICGHTTSLLIGSKVSAESMPRSRQLVALKDSANMSPGFDVASKVIINWLDYLISEGRMLIIIHKQTHCLAQCSSVVDRTSHLRCQPWKLRGMGETIDSSLGRQLSQLQIKVRWICILGYI